MAGDSRSRVGTTFVVGQMLLIALVLLLPSGSAWTVPGWLLVVLVLMMAGGVALVLTAARALGPGLTAMPIPNQRAELRTGGVFALVRHPIYTGLLAAAIAWTVRSGSPWTVLACVALVVWMVAKARWEEARLRERFPDYGDYAARTGMLLPRLRRP